MVGMASIIFASMSLHLSRKNEGRRNGEEDAKIANMSEDDVAELGDESPRFIFNHLSLGALLYRIEASITLSL